MVPPIVFAGSDLLFNDSGLLVLVVDRFCSITINSKEVRGSADGICLPDGLKELLPLRVADDGVDLVDALPCLLGFRVRVLGGAEHFHGRCFAVG